jgi:hypothetical protein
VAVSRTGKRILIGAVVLAAAVALLAYLRDPPWLLTYSSGFGEWRRDPEGVRFRWMGGHASFFVPSNARGLDVPLRTSFAPGDWPIAASITIDSRESGRIVMADGEWHTVSLRLPPPGGRRVRRIDIRLDRLREEDRGVIVGEPRIR